MLCLFVSHLFIDQLSPQTVKSYLSAVRYTQIALGLGDPRVDAMPQLEYVLKGVKRSSSKKTRPRLPITPQILLQLKHYWESLSPHRDALMLWAAACLCFFGFLRSGEVVIPSDSCFDASVHLAFGDVVLDDLLNPSFLEVRLKSSKTDPFRKGVTVIVGRTHSPQGLCPVVANIAYMVARGFSQGPYFTFEDGKALTRDRFVRAIRVALAAEGIQSSLYSGHSFRIGAATTAAANGISDVMIKTMGRWESAAYTLYVRTPRDQLRDVARVLVR